jgi:hypothetical protein
MSSRRTRPMTPHAGSAPFSVFVLDHSESAIDADVGQEGRSSAKAQKGAVSHAALKGLVPSATN